MSNKEILLELETKERCLKETVDELDFAGSSDPETHVTLALNKTALHVLYY